MATIRIPDMPFPASTPRTPGAHIRGRRAELRLTQTDLAVLTGINQTRISLIERERVLPNPGELATLLGVLST